MTSASRTAHLGLALVGCLAVAACSATVDGTEVTAPVETVAPPTSSTASTTAASTTTSSTSTSTTTSSTTTTSTASTTTSTTSTTSTSTTTTSSTTTSTTAPDDQPVGLAADGLPLATLPTPLPHASNLDIWRVRPPSDITPPAIPADWNVSLLGTTHLGRQIELWRRVPDGATTRVIVVGGIHGNEPVSPPIVRSLVTVDHPDDVAVWLVPVLNPDGSMSGTRSNGVGVDLNRNFGWDWWPSDGGAAPFSEPETAAIVGLITEVRPDLVVWVHQPLNYVSSIGTTSDAYEQAWSRGSGVPVRPDVTQHGGGESWTNLSAGYPSMLVEVATWAATPEIVAAHRNGYVELLAVL